MIPHVKKCLASVATGKCSKPNSISFEVVRDGWNSDLLLTKLKFFTSIAKQITPFLTLYQTYQTDKPKAIFLCDDLFKLLKSLMTRIVKPSVVKDITSPAKLISVQLTKTDNLFEY